MPDRVDMALFKEIAAQIEASNERCRAADSSEASAAEVVVLAQESIARGRIQMAPIDASRAARWRVIRKGTTN
jgi:microcompartment protein CcmK/EutM